MKVRSKLGMLELERQRWVNEGKLRGIKVQLLESGTEWSEHEVT